MGEVVLCKPDKDVCEIKETTWHGVPGAHIYCAPVNDATGASQCTGGTEKDKTTFKCKCALVLEVIVVGEDYKQKTHYDFYHTGDDPARLVDEDHLDWEVTKTWIEEKKEWWYKDRKTGNRIFCMCVKLDKNGDPIGKPAKK